MFRFGGKKVRLSTEQAKRVLVVGGSGFLGFHISEALRNSGAQVSIAGRDTLAKALQSDYESIVWAAGGRVSSQTALQEQHVAGPLRALASLMPNGRFVFLSSGEVYGPSKVPFAEFTRPESTTEYGLAKLKGEARLGAAAELQGARLTCLRIALAYGPRQQGSMFVPSLVRHLLDRTPFATSPGGQTRDYIYCTDVANATVLALAEGAPSGIFNVGSGIEISLKDIALSVQREFDAQTGLESLELIRFGELPYRANEQMRYVLSTARSKSELGIEPKVALADGLARLIKAARQ